MTRAKLAQYDGGGGGGDTNRQYMPFQLSCMYVKMIICTPHNVIQSNNDVRMHATFAYQDHSRCIGHSPRRLNIFIADLRERNQSVPFAKRPMSDDEHNKCVQHGTITSEGARVLRDFNLRARDTRNPIFIWKEVHWVVTLSSLAYPHTLEVTRSETFRRQGIHVSRKNGSDVQLNRRYSLAPSIDTLIGALFPELIFQKIRLSF